MTEPVRTRYVARSSGFEAMLIEAGEDSCTSATANGARLGRKELKPARSKLDEYSSLAVSFCEMEVPYDNPDKGRR